MARVQSKGYRDPPLKNGTVEVICSLEKTEGNMQIEPKAAGTDITVSPFFLFYLLS